MNLSFHEQDFSIQAAWTFTSSGHGKSACDGLGAAVKSAARKHLLKQGPESAFLTTKDFYSFTFERANRMLKPTVSSLSILRNKTTTKDKDDDGTTTQNLPPMKSIEVRWLDSEYVQKKFDNFLKPRWNQLSSKGKT